MALEVNRTSLEILWITDEGVGLLAERPLPTCKGLMRELNLIIDPFEALRAKQLLEGIKENSSLLSIKVACHS